MQDAAFTKISPKYYIDLRDFVKTVTIYGQKKTMNTLAKKCVQQINYYVPKKTGFLQRAGYTIRTGVEGRNTSPNPYFTIEYNNDVVPYALYQYYGEVWGPNYAVFEHNITLTKDPANTAVSYKHVGWVSKKGKNTKKNMHRPIGIRRTIILNNGKRIDIKGYTKKRPKHQNLWVERFVKSRRFDTWIHMTGQHIVNDITRQYATKRGKHG